MPAPALHLVPAPAAGVYSIARSEDPFAWNQTPAINPGQDEGLLTGNRFDAPAGQYMTRYYGTDTFTCCVEKIAVVRRSGLSERIDAAVDPDPQDERFGTIATPVVPADLLDGRVLAHVHLEPQVRLIDVDHHETIQAAGALLGDAFLRQHDLAQFDRSLATHQNRRVTRHYALALHQLAAAHVDRIIGLTYQSTFGRGLSCYALWHDAEPHISARDVIPLDLTHPDLERAADLFGLQVPAPDVAPLPPGFPNLRL